MRIIFICIVIAAIGYLGFTFKDEIRARAASNPLVSNPAPSAETTPAAPLANQTETPVSATPEEKRLAPPGIFYVTTRVAVQQDTGIKALNPGEEVKLMYHNKDGTARVSVGKYDFVVNETDLTNDLNVAQKIAMEAAHH